MRSDLKKADRLFGIRCHRVSVGQDLRDAQRGRTSQWRSAGALTSDTEGERVESSGHGRDRITTVADLRARRFERSIQHDRRYEHAALIDNAAGQVLVRTRGTRQAVSFDDEHLMLMRGNVLSHNHPDGWHYPVDDPRHGGAGFSIDDVRMLTEWDLAEIRAITPRFLYRLRPSQDSDSFYHRTVRGISPQMLEMTLRRVFIDTLVDLERRIGAGEIMAAAAETELPHRALVRLREDWGIEHEREEFP